MSDLLRSAQSGKSRKGKSALIKYLKGGKLTRSASIAGKCYDCDGMGESGICTLSDCVLFPYSPYSHSGEVESDVRGTI